MRIQIKDTGLGDTVHNPVIPDDVVAEIWKLIKNIHDVMIADDPTTDEFKKLIQKIPEYHGDGKTKHKKGTCK